MLPSVDLGIIFPELIAKFHKDELHMSMFITAVAKKTVEITQQEVSALNPFVSAAADLVGQWIHKATHLGITDIESGDPFKPLRDETRMFANRWVLDPAFIAALG